MQMKRLPQKSGTATYIVSRYIGTKEQRTRAKQAGQQVDGLQDGGADILPTEAAAPAARPKLERIGIWNPKTPDLILVDGVATPQKAKDVLIQDGELRQFQKLVARRRKVERAYAEAHSLSRINHDLAALPLHIATVAEHLENAGTGLKALASRLESCRADVRGLNIDGLLSDRAAQELRDKVRVDLSPAYCARLVLSIARVIRAMPLSTLRVEAVAEIRAAMGLHDGEEVEESAPDIEGLWGGTLGE